MWNQRMSPCHNLIATFDFSYTILWSIVSILWSASNLGMKEVRSLYFILQNLQSYFNAPIYLAVMQYSVMSCSMRELNYFDLHSKRIMILAKWYAGQNKLILESSRSYIRSVIAHQYTDGQWQTFFCQNSKHKQADTDQHLKV